MPDLHGWISQKIDESEERARACPPWPWTHETDDDAVVASDGIQVAEVMALSGRQAHATGVFIAAIDPAAILRRCAADRRVLARHNIDPAKAGWSEAAACKGCGVYGDCDWPEIDNLNDCPELLDLAAGYGLTDDELVALDRPESRRQEPGTRPDWDVFGKSLDEALRPANPTAAVSAALRGPKWKAQP